MAPPLPARLPLLVALAIAALSTGSYCVPSSSGNARGAIEKVGGSCPLGLYASGNYCHSSPSNDREVGSIQTAQSSNCSPSTRLNSLTLWLTTVAPMASP